jgi:hypothetical protein
MSSIKARLISLSPFGSYWNDDRAIDSSRHYILIDGDVWLDHGAPHLPVQGLSFLD